MHQNRPALVQCLLSLFIQQTFLYLVVDTLTFISRHHSPLSDLFRVLTEKSFSLTVFVKIYVQFFKVFYKNKQKKK